MALYDEEEIMRSYVENERYEAKYNEQIKSMPEPIMASELPKVKLNLRGIRKYARKKGVSIAGLTDEEKQLFINR